MALVGHGISQPHGAADIVNGATPKQRSATSATPLAKYWRPTWENCERSKNTEIEALCLNRRSTEASEIQADQAALANEWSQKQYWLAWWQMGGLLFSLVFTGWAAFSAARATKVAVRAEVDAGRNIELAGKSAEALLMGAEIMKRAQAAYLDVSSWEIVQRSPEEVYHGLEVSALWKNVGPTQALDVVSFVALAFVNPVELEKGLNITYERWSNPRNVGAGQGFGTEGLMLPREWTILTWQGRAAPLLYSCSIYRNVFGSDERIEERCVILQILGDPSVPVNVENPPWRLIQYSNFTSKLGAVGTGGIHPRD